MKKIKTVEVNIVYESINVDFYTFIDVEECNNILRTNYLKAEGATAWYYNTISVFFREDKVNNVGLITHECLHATKRIMDYYGFNCEELEATILEHLVNNISENY